ncbi:hypothetical protein C7S20_19335 [Christiangramia fulva]|uniref:Uncharacterized protein n=1 Tax=Christiangramia fulva TaxID=2126553 RepID=A0A2R3ZAN5_9FLAO|nr:hypothetical protein [Christiangramia fulva]AVR47232.1 hypothetical protein C7S20_19335 [Christiangramia fulva]
MKKVEEIPTVQTRFQEEIITTADLDKMKGKYLAERLLRTWIKDFIDEDNGDVVSLDRNEIIYDKGTFITSDVLSEINFHLQTNEVKEVKVSNQKRIGFLSGGFTSVWQATAKFNNKKFTYLLYASSLSMAFDIATDFLEQDLPGGFQLHTLKELDYSNLIVVEEDEEELDFYKIELEVDFEYQEPYESSYILKSHDAETAKRAIVEYIAKKAKEENRRESFDVTIISAKTITCSGIVDYKFSQEYFESLKSKTA